MYLPIGQRKLSEKQIELLLKLGFDPSKMQQRGDGYYLEVPENSKIDLTRDRDPERNDFETIVIKYNGIEVIGVLLKTAPYDSKTLSFTISEEAVEKALAMTGAAIAEKNLAEGKLTEYQQKLAGRLADLAACVRTGGPNTSGAERQLRYLRDLKNENPTEHDQLINSNEDYKNLLKLFPNWVNESGQQHKLQNQPRR
jgi:hypothetical protein